MSTLFTVFLVLLGIACIVTPVLDAKDYLWHVIPKWHHEDRHRFKIIMFYSWLCGFLFCGILLAFLRIA